MKPSFHTSGHRYTTAGRWIACALAVQVATVAVPATPGWADDATERATGKAIKAQALFKSGQFIKAAEAFLEAYAVAPKATLLFNAARAYEEAKALDEAIALYQRYLTLKDADAAGKADAHKRLAELTERRAAATPIGDTAGEQGSQQAHAVEPSPLPVPGGQRKDPLDTGDARPAGNADTEARRGAVAAARDVDSEVSSALWFVLGCAVVGVPLAYLSEPAPTPSRLLGRSEAWALGYTSEFQRLAGERHRQMAKYGCLTGLAVTVISSFATR